MLFVEFRFFVFFAIIFCVHWALQSNTARKIWLLIASYFFYTCFFLGDALNGGPLPDGWWFPLVLFGSTCMDYTVGIGIENAKSERGRKFWMLVSVCANIGVLCYFKYFNFFLTSASAFFTWIGFPVSIHTLNIILPYGVSFYTFQSMSYSLDVYRRRLPAVRNFLDLAFFISFFPQLVAGPIVRALTFLPQVFVKREFASVDVRAALVLFMIGFIKKSCIAEGIAPIVDDYFAAPESFTALSAWIGILFYAVQIYCDFSGYTDMAIASARLLGYELTINFAFPYFAQNITEFWRRWHISLSTWLRDYLYISLGGNRGSKIFTYRNLMLTMLIGGLWHGSRWTFVIWGALHGAALIAHREWTRHAERSAMITRAMTYIGPFITFYFVCIAWIFFRASDFDKAATSLKSFMILESPGAKTIDPAWLLLFAGLALIHWMNSRGWFSTWWRRGPDWLFAAGYGVAAAVVLLFIPMQYKPFIYFQF
jgi:alginate O-acetyltransferase complex protein AlgI